jgi:hypothetical protein
MFRESNWCSTMKVTFEGHGVRYGPPQAANIFCLKYMETTSDYNIKDSRLVMRLEDIRIEWSQYILYCYTDLR